MSNFFSTSSPYYQREMNLGQTLVIKHCLGIISIFQEHPCTYKMGIWTSLVPMLSWNANIYRAESLVSFVCKHDVIKIGQKQKGNICALFNQLRFNAQCVCYSIPDS